MQARTILIGKTVGITFGMGLVAGVCVGAGSAPEVEIGNRTLHVRLYLPDDKGGLYRGTRFDWSGVIAGLEYAGHSYYPRWFQRTDLSVQDFIYDGPAIVAGPCTAITGPAEEFAVLGFDEAKPGGTFVKIGVGVLRRPDEAKYSAYRLYPIQDGGKWAATRNPGSIQFEQQLTDPSTGFAYVYQKTVSLMGDEPKLVLEHSLRNTGKRPIQTTVYNHNFLYLDQQAPSSEFVLSFPFEVRTSQPRVSGLAVIREKQISFSRRLSGDDRVYLDIRGFREDAKDDYDIRIENRSLGAGLRITADQPMSRLALWAIRAPVSIEPFIAIRIEPGADFTWRINYEYYTVPKR